MGLWLFSSQSSACRIPPSVIAAPCVRALFVYPFDLDQVIDRIDHASNLGGSLVDDRISDAAKAEDPYRRLLAPGTLIGTSNLSDLELSHDPKASSDEESTSR